MKLYGLGLPDAPCTVVEFAGLTLMLDCPLALSSLLRYAPDVQPRRGPQSSAAKRAAAAPAVQPPQLSLVDKEWVVEGAAPRLRAPTLDFVDPAAIDVVLISSWSTALALPYLTEHTGFQGKILITAAAHTVARAMLTELATLAADVRRPDDVSWWSRDPDVLTQASVSEAMPRARYWLEPYTAAEVEESLARATPVHTHERVSLFGSLTVWAAANGSSLGGCNWVIETPSEKIAYLADCSTAQRYPQLLDTAALKGSDVVIIGSQPAPSSVLPVPDAIRDIFEQCLSTVVQGGNVLFPISAVGHVFDLIEHLYRGLNSRAVYPSMVFVSPAAPDVMSFTSVCAEWLSSPKADRVFVPEPPFEHTALANTGALRVFARASGGDAQFAAAMKEPYIVFAGHASCRLGDTVPLLNLFAANDKSCVILTEPLFTDPLVLLPFQPLRCRVHVCPFDPRATAAAMSDIVRDIHPRHVVVPEPPACAAGPGAEKPEQVACPAGSALTQLAHLQARKVPLKRKLAEGSIAPELARAIRTTTVGGLAQGDTRVAAVSARLDIRDNCFNVCADPRAAAGAPARPGGSSSRLLGRPSLAGVVRALAQGGADDVSVLEDRGHEWRIAVSRGPATATVTEAAGETLVETDDEDLRVLIRDVVVRGCLRELS
eukprot:m51a1_g7590 hypothetical protein (659) ;mRNA; f:211549-213850